MVIGCIISIRMVGCVVAGFSGVPAGGGGAAAEEAGSAAHQDEGAGKRRCLRSHQATHGRRRRESKEQMVSLTPDSQLSMCPSSVRAVL